MHKLCGILLPKQRRIFLRAGRAPLLDISPTEALAAFSRPTPTPHYLEKLPRGIQVIVAFSPLMTLPRELHEHLPGMRLTRLSPSAVPVLLQLKPPPPL